ncbi:MAG TPA: 30S ribosomal protein S6 [Candidatus Hydrogenedentes bacterium]|nr:30S ribosomal protein S6 [Candidatus Hydrogenedentota bacterium]HIJ73300.1 30S ribosomal protein S6 [Candidatus Hydrogenedentota bacterium]
MRTYEALYIVRPDLDDETIQTVAKEVESLVTDNGGAIVRSEIWGKRRLAYVVEKFNEGCYVLLRFNSEPVFIARLESHFRLKESIIRFLVVHFDAQMLRLEAEQQRRQEDQLRASASVARRRFDADEAPGRAERAAPAKGAKETETEEIRTDVVPVAGAVADSDAAVEEDEGSQL